MCSSTGKVLGACSPEELVGPEGARRLEASLDRDQRRKDGVYFTGSHLAEHVAERVRHLVENGATIADPTCGGGDLLLACLKLFSLEENPSATARVWSERIKGFDLQSGFVDAARLRMAALVKGLHEDREFSLSALAEEFQGVAQGDYTERAAELSFTDVIVANPPFGSIPAPPLCEWSTGKTQRAAIYLDQMIENAKPGQNIVAVLPDVLRSGTRYQRWRRSVEARCEVADIYRYGRFGESADIDVFILHVIKREESVELGEDCAWAAAQGLQSEGKLADSFEVSVGPVVPHRHGNSGAWCYYLDVSVAVPNAEVSVLAKRRFKGRLFLPPFIVIRRTSSPSDRQRIVPTLVLVNGPVAVENHLIVIVPKIGGLVACQLLMNNLRKKGVDAWVNRANGCRHLTKGLVENIPLEEIL